MRPQSADYPLYYQQYVNLAEGNDIKTILSESLPKLESFFSSITETKAGYAYALGKWTVKQVLQHCIDTERIFAYRALCHARGELQPLPGFEQNDYAAAAGVVNRSVSGLAEEMLLVRKSTQILFQNFTDTDLNRTGRIGDNAIKTFCWGFIITGHFIHHQNILIHQYGI